MGTPASLSDSIPTVVRSGGLVVNGETQKAKPCTHSTEDLHRQLESGLARDLRERQPRFLKRVRGEIEHREQSLGGTADGPLEKIGIDNPEALYPPHLSLAFSPPPPSLFPLLF